ncbi:hypothetical protein BDP27DRAFT_1318498 [Rhodocollybia butyracea]|uniref:N-acetyltransferase domain-containing protein n=1 Tax=Rhodocollybia butyracea TaxID=206335 RepID=A0A9P5UAZ7_9AGAR|nr:hypothetical protein BDP27DRAFT_1318498 [Rhodocollybia butyracea]
MPSALDFSVLPYKQVKQIPDFVLNALEDVPADANVILPLIKKLFTEPPSARCTPEQLWLFCVSEDTVDLALSCTENAMGKYPVFIAPTRRLSPESLAARLRVLADKLCDLIPRERVYSVFAPDEIALLFSQRWSELTGIAIIPEPYYAARLWSCADLKPVPNDYLPPPGISRLANADDTQAVAQLCFGFARESEPFVLERSGALKEAKLLIEKEQVWVHYVSEGGSSPQMTCIAAFTRNTENMATITKVYTPGAHRCRGYAKHLVREVCEHLLSQSSKRELAVLYVGRDNKGAAKVYKSVGFAGPAASDVHGHTENWIEIGFDQDKVKLGHW